MYPDDADIEVTDGQFVKTLIEACLYSYRMGLGDWDTSSFGEVAVPVVWTLFILCTIFNLIVMMNLLIAIISETFAKVNEIAESAGFQETAKMISENSYLIPTSIIKKKSHPDSYLLFASQVEPAVEEKDEMGEKIDNLKYFLEKQHEEQYALIEENQEKLNYRLEVVTALVKGEEPPEVPASMKRGQTTMLARKPTMH